MRTQPRWYDEAQKEKNKWYAKRQKQRKKIRDISWSPHAERALDLEDGFSIWNFDIDHAQKDVERTKNSNIRRPLQQTRKTGFLRKETFNVCPRCGKELDIYRQGKPYTSDGYLTYYHKEADCDYEYTEKNEHPWS